MSERDDSIGFGRYAASVDAHETDGADGREGLVDALAGAGRDARLNDLAALASVAIETSLVTDLSGTLHNLFDPICDKTLPIYFGPLLGRLYLEGL